MPILGSAVSLFLTCNHSLSVFVTVFVLFLSPSMSLKLFTLETLQAEQQLHDAVQASVVS